MSIRIAAKFFGPGAPNARSVSGAALRRLVLRWLLVCVGWTCPWKFAGLPAICGHVVGTCPCQVSTKQGEGLVNRIEKRFI